MIGVILDVPISHTLPLFFLPFEEGSILNRFQYLGQKEIDRFNP
jgi:hypothetical protein